MLRSLFVAGFVFVTTIILRATEVGPVEVPLTIDSNAPAIKMLVPGFTVHELPLNLNNINSLVCAPDGASSRLATTAMSFNSRKAPARVGGHRNIFFQK